MKKQICLAVLVILASVTLAHAQKVQLATVSSELTPEPTVESNVRTALSIINKGCVEIVLVRKAVVVGIPCRLLDGDFDHSFRRAIMEDQRLAQKQEGYKSHWRRTPGIFAKIFRDGKHPYRERVKEGGLEADRYDATDKNLPDYILRLVQEDNQEAKLTGIRAPPYYWKMDVDYGHGVRNFFRQELLHFVLRKSTSQSEIAETLKRRIDALGQQALAPRKAQLHPRPRLGEPVKVAGVFTNDLAPQE
ncbi:MAG: hypothetical protein ACR2LM_11550 [Pyrinomonadaceae bacterium]